jgi:mycothiol synthase
VRYLWRMEIQLETPPPAPQGPDGVSVRTCIRSQDERIIFGTLEEAFRDYWGHVPRDYDEWYARNVASSSYHPSLWRLATAADGEAAGVIRCRLQPDGMGWVDTLGVLQLWRKHGLGMALIRQAFGEFYRRGVSTVELGVDAQNPTGATRLYERAGMRVTRHFAVYGKELRSGMDFLDQSES